MQGIVDLINNSEVLEPETLDQLFPGISEKDKEKILVLKVIKNTRAFAEDMDVFENVVHVLNGLPATVDTMLGCLPEQIWYALNVINRLRPDIKYSHEVKMYCKYIFNDYGIYFYHPILQILNPHYENVVYKATYGPFPLKETFLDIQAAKYLAIQQYVKGKEHAINT